MTLSVWGRKTHEVLMITYLDPDPLAVQSGAGWPSPRSHSVRRLRRSATPCPLGMAPWSRTPTTWPTPRTWTPGKVDWTNYLGFLGGCLGVSGLLAGLATLRIRTVVLRQAGRPAAGARCRGRAAAPRPARLPCFARPVARRQPGGVAGVAPVAAVVDDAGGLGHVLGPRRALDRADAAGPDISESTSRLEAIAAMNVFQVGVGLLLLSVGAATSLAEERVRGSLDVLLDHPAVDAHDPGRQVVGGVPAGPSRPDLAGRRRPACSSWTAATCSPTSGCSALIAAYGAAITSLGLALATWVSRLGRAVALCVTAYVGFCDRLADPDRPDVPARARGSDEPSGTRHGKPAVRLVPRDGRRRPRVTIRARIAEAVWGGDLLWIVIHVAVAAALFAMTASSFDQCLGRVSETPSFPILDPTKRPHEELDPDY